MASQAQIERTYNFMDELIRANFGEYPDVSCAFYDGDYTKSLHQAQKDKHRFIFECLRVKPGTDLLDIGCGWGPILNAARERGAHGVGITLSTKQLKACRGSGLDVELKDWRDLTPSSMRKFDAIVTIGALEHFCSPEEYLAGEQEDVYRRFFRLCWKLLRERGRLYVQTMLWSDNAPAYADISMDAPEGSDERVCAMVKAFFPGSWVPYGCEQLIRCSEPYFELVLHNDGRLDYVETGKQWSKLKWTPRTIFAAAKLVQPWLTSREFRMRTASLRASCNQQLFIRNIFTLGRLVLERRVTTPCGERGE